MGELDFKPFMKAAEIKYVDEDVLEKATELCFLWEDHIRDSSWQPYKVVMEGETAKVCLLWMMHHFVVLSLHCIDIIFKFIFLFMISIHLFGFSRKL